MRCFPAIAMLCFSLPAIAQMKVCMGGNLDAMNPADTRLCENQVRMAREAGVSTKAPADWHFVVVCGEDGWKDYAAFSTHPESQVRVAAADTDFANKTTFLRGTRLTSSDASNQVIAAAFLRPAEGIQIALK
jgi:hypothetical protein